MKIQVLITIALAVVLTAWQVNANVHFENVTSSEKVPGGRITQQGVAQPGGEIHDWLSQNFGNVSEIQPVSYSFSFVG